MLLSEKMLPKFILENPFMKELLNAEENEIKRFEKHVENVRKELNILTADRLINRYEKIFDIKSFGLSKKERINNILAKLNTIGRCRVEDVENLVKIATGRKGKVIEYFDDYSFEVVVNLFFGDNTSKLLFLKKQIEEIKPCHLAFVIIMYLEVIIFKNINTTNINCFEVSIRNNNFGVKSHYLNGFNNLDGSFTLSRNKGKDVKLNLFSSLFSCENKVSSESYITENTMWELDGTFDLSGNKKIDARIERSVL